MTPAQFLYLDIETRSAVDLKKAGSHVYFESDTTDLWVACYAFGGGPVETWLPGERCPERVTDHVRGGGMISGWNVAGFEMLAWNALLWPKYGWPLPRLEQYDDTAAMAAAMALPRDLAGASQALGLDVQKDMEGRGLMLRMSKPRKPRKGEPDGLYWTDEPEKLARLAAYCRTDVEAERAARKRLVPLSDDERAVWLLDARINNRGVRVDTKLVKAMLRIVEQQQAKLDREMTLATGGYVTAASQVAALTRWLQGQGVPAESLAKAALADLLELDDVPDHCRAALEVRREAAKSSTAKLKAALECVGRDERVRGLHLYHGASTGRWAGKLLQTQNFPRGSGVVKDPESAAKWMRKGDAGLISLMYGPPLSAVSDCLRSIITAAPGRDFIAADFSAIEGRVTAWLAGEEDELEAYRKADAGEGPGIYEIAAAGIFNVPVGEIGKKDVRRQIGKTACLSMGYAGGVNAFHSMAQVYGVNMATALPSLWDAAGEETRERATGRYEECLKRNDAGTDRMDRDTWLASELTKVGWRARHPATVRAWKLLENAAFEAVSNPGSVISVLRVKYLARRGFLWCQLPSGRCLAYGGPKIQDVEVPWADKTQPPARREKKAAVTCLGVNGVTRKWERFVLYSGLCMENCVQAIARDVMANAMLKAETEGYPIVLTVHDELVAEVPEGSGGVREFERLICELPDWAEGLPLAASGWRGVRYKKD